MKLYKKYKYIILVLILLLLVLISSIYLYNKDKIIELFNNFTLNNNNDGKITVILNVYKRPHTLIEQIKAVKNQTIPPSEIIVYNNHVENYDIPEISNELKSNVTIIKSEKNFGVWARFGIALLANTEYVCIFDDDTIPGKKWFENCINTMKETPGLLGSRGVIFKKGNNYNLEEDVGWTTQNSNIKEVDIVGHSWFFRREWLQYLWEIVPNYTTLLKAGEDIAFSAVLQKHNIKTYVPPHPKEDTELHGGNLKSGHKYGGEKVGISSDPKNLSRMDDILQYFIKELGFKTINNR